MRSGYCEGVEGRCVGPSIVRLSVRPSIVHPVVVSRQVALLLQRSRAMLPTCLFSVNSAIRVHSFVVSYFGIRMIRYHCVQLNVVLLSSVYNVEPLCHKHFVVRLPRTTNNAAYQR